MGMLFRPCVPNHPATGARRARLRRDHSASSSDLVPVRTLYLLMWRRVQMPAAGPAPRGGAEEGSASKAEAGKAAEGSEVLDEEGLAWRNRRDAV